jgi:hypothetical protein
MNATQTTTRGKMTRAFKDDEHEFRVLPPKEGDNASKVLYYVRSTALMARLDEAFGVAGWNTQVKDVEGPGGSRGLAVTLVVTMEGREVVKTGVGTHHVSDTEDVVSAYDGALARAAAQLGIGRYLWEIPEIYADLTDAGLLAHHPLDLLLEHLPRD